MNGHHFLCKTLLYDAKDQTQSNCGLFFKCTEYALDLLNQFAAIIQI